MDMDWNVVVSTGTLLVVTISIYLHKNRKSTIDTTLTEIKHQQAHNHQELKAHQEKITTKQDEIYKEVKATNGKVIALEKFAAMHEESDNRRFEALQGQLQEVKRGG